MSSHRKPRGISVSTAQIVIMILLGTVGVLMVLGAQLLSRPTGRHGRKTA